jgi:hypothetical protein
MAVSWSHPGDVEMTSVSEQLLNRFMDIVGWVVGEGLTPASYPAKSKKLSILDLRETLQVTGWEPDRMDLRRMLEAEFDCTDFAVYELDMKKGVLWPTGLFGEHRIDPRPVDLMSNHSLRNAIEGKVGVAFQRALQLEGFHAPVSAFVPLLKTGQTYRMLVLFDTPKAASILSQKGAELLLAVNETSR